MKYKKILAVLLILTLTCMTGNSYVYAEEFLQEETPEETYDESGSMDESEDAENSLTDGENSDEEIIEDQIYETDEIVSEQRSEIRFEQAGEDAPYDMKINLLSNPYGVTKEKMSFSWKDSNINGMQKQTAYRIVVSGRIENIRRSQYLYDTGWISSAQNISVQYDLSGTLQDNELYYWQVQIKNTDGVESSLSEPQAFTTAVGSNWVNKDGIWGSSDQKTVMMRHEIEKMENVEKAVISVTASSTIPTCQYVYSLYVNGEEIGVGPARQNGSVLYYNTYDVTDVLKEGKNTVGAICYSESNSAFLCQITYYYSDGSSQVITNSGRDSGAWKVLDADNIYIGNDTTSIGTSYYTARRDNLNGTVYPAGWTQAGYNASAWSVPTKNSVFSRTVFESVQIENMKHYEVIPQSVTKSGSGNYLIDFGKEFVGSLQLSGDFSKNTSITIEYGEELNSDGSVKYNLNTGNKYQEKWTLKAGNQTLAGIGMKTFRYVMIRGLYSDISVDNIRGLSLRQEFNDEKSDFDSSNSVLNDLYDMVKHTSKVTNQDVYVDTQNRERRPYEGDAFITALTSYSFSDASPSAKFSAEYLLNNTTWPAEYSIYNIMLVYENYLYTGDIRDLEESYQLLKKKTLEQYYDSSQGLMKTVSVGDASGQRIMVDWPNSEIDGYRISDSYYNTVFNAVCVGGYADMAEIAKVLGHTQESSYYQNLSDTIKKNMIQKMYNSSTGEFYDGLDSGGYIVEHSAQHATAYAMAFGVYADQAMADAMYASIESDGEVKMSVYGTYFLLQGLYRTNHGELARQIMSNSEDVKGVKSWGYMMYGLGATTTSEAWNSSLKANMSLCHPWGSVPASMLIRGMFGIRPTTAGFDTFQVKLQPGGLSSASTKVPTLKGTIEVSYSLNGNGEIAGNITVPPNSTGTLLIPVSNQADTIMIDGCQTETQKEAGYLSCQLQSGTYSFSVNSGILQDNSEWLKEDVVYSTYANSCWAENVTNELESGKSSDNKIEAIRIGIRNQKTPGGIEYSAYMQSYGWQNWCSTSQESGMAGSGKRLEAFRIRLTGELAKVCDIYYRAYVQGIGWLDWAENGEPAGTSGYSKEVSMIQISLREKGTEVPGDMAEAYRSKDEKQLVYSTHVQSFGWQQTCGDGEISGTVGSAKRLEGIKISVQNVDVSGGITYQTHVQSYGWQDWKSDGQIAGTTGQAKRLEAIKIKLTGNLEKQYDVYYRVHVQTFGWLGWAKNGESAGSEGYAKRLEAIQIKLVRKGNTAPGTTNDAFRKAAIGYRTHVQSYGWQSYVYDGAMSGTTGEAKRLEAIQIENMDSSVSGSVQYRTHIQSYGWESGWKSNGQMSGTSGKAKRLEAIQIRLTGEMSEKYDIYYRVHAQTYGWLGWAKNGESAGTEGLAKRLEGIEIVLVEKDGKAPGSVENAFLKAR
ncbi:MAG: family 78 glycoside hydrolase catalytic domain [Eubacteriales bacterium]|nr:family 78 glycoside hydrolase catalytic domain [Eubacteriales bacterium]